MVASVKKQAVTGSPMPSTCGFSASKKFGGTSSGIPSIASRPSNDFNKSGLAFLIVAARLSVTWELMSSALSAA